ncbi:MAG: hypothetical protein LBN00_05370 [Oscillospiraceae bacterium]|jgi:hypothetical protein|nr:hypothetical protein [Oscillospiraceae bacterium]
MRYKLNIAAFAVVCAAFALLVIAFPRDLRTIERENRNFNLLEITVENVFGGGFDRDVEAYVSDRVGYRADFVTLAARLRELSGLPAADHAKIVGSVLSADDGLAEIFAFDGAAAADYAAALNAYRAELGENVRVFSLIAPTRIEFMEPKYSRISDSELDAIRAVNAGLSDGITPVDAYSALAEHSDEYIYFRTDHHWTARGAYYAYRAFADAAGFVPLGLDDYSVGRLDGFLGYLYNFAPSAAVASSPDYIEYFTCNGALTTSPELLKLPAAGEKTEYRVFLGGDYDELTIETSVKNGKTAVVIKDSYANCLVPWLAPHYERLVLLDPRSFEGSALEKIREYGDADIDLLFVNYVFSTSFADFAQLIDEMR